ncbi:MAG: hypothetical protein Q8L80_01790 [Gallionella sp.]|nr:hypothetical protein [Gallionella sp.]MDP1941770.1 hypothetical protein [Gallionella sp.]
MLKLFVIKPSVTFASLLLAVHLLAVVSVYLIPVVNWARLSLSLLLFFSLFYHLYRYALLRSHNSWRCFSLDQKHITVNTQGGAELCGELAHSTVVIAHCVVLCARLEGYKLPVCQVIFSDALPGEAFRELRVRLKYA